MNNVTALALLMPVDIQTARKAGRAAGLSLMPLSFATILGGKNNTLILGPGGSRFGDYWRIGLPLEILVVAVSVRLVLVFWPL